MATRKREYTDEEIRHELDTAYGYGRSDFWLSLSEQTDDKELKRRCDEKFSAAYRAEEYSADLL